MNELLVQVFLLVVDLTKASFFTIMSVSLIFNIHKFHGKITIHSTEQFAADRLKLLEPSVMLQHKQGFFPVDSNIEIYRCFSFLSELWPSVKVTADEPSVSYSEHTAMGSSVVFCSVLVQH